MQNLLIGLLTAASIAYLGYRFQALNSSGAITAAVLGTVVFGLAGKAWAVVMLAFFLSSSLLSRLTHPLKKQSALNFSKGSRRDAWQVAVNGGMAGFLALIYFILTWFTPESIWVHYLWIGFASSLAAANADTWATELGLLNPRKPILLSTFKRVPVGTSGGVSLVGTLASIAGSALIGGTVVLCDLLGWSPAEGLDLPGLFLVITGCGMLGSLVDSLLGAVLQATYYCELCRKETEQHPVHRCGSPTMHLRGLHWVNNDWVNAACTISAGTAGLLLAIFTS